jgi:hypothetical protein
MALEVSNELVKFCLWTLQNTEVAGVRTLSRKEVRPVTLLFYFIDV